MKFIYLLALFSCLGVIFCEELIFDKNGGHCPADSKDCKQENRSKNPLVNLDIRIGGKKTGEIKIELRRDIVPKTADNFLKICTKDGVDFSFNQTIFHRIIPQFMAQGGDMTNHDGTGGRSIYGRKFKDENFILKHNEAGVVSMANSGPDSNGSQFFITFQKTPWLDNRHVVFGKVVSGFDVLEKMEMVGSTGGKTQKKVQLFSCVQIKGD